MVLAGAFVLSAPSAFSGGRRDGSHRGGGYHTPTPTPKPTPKPTPCPTAKADAKTNPLSDGNAEADAKTNPLSYGNTKADADPNPDPNPNANPDPATPTPPDADTRRRLRSAKLSRPKPMLAMRSQMAALLVMPFISLELIPAPLLLATNYSNGTGFKYVFSPAGSFVENIGDGTAHLTGHIESLLQPGHGFDVDVIFTGRMRRVIQTWAVSARAIRCSSSIVAAMSIRRSRIRRIPVQPRARTRERSIRQPGIIYSNFSGTFTGTGDYAGAVLMIMPTMHCFQVGDGANGKNVSPGASGWFVWEVVSQPTSGCDLLSSSEGESLRRLQLRHPVPEPDADADADADTDA